MLKLSKATEEKVQKLFPAECWKEAAFIMEEECGNNLPFCEKLDEFQMERIRFAVLKLSKGDMEKLKSWVKDAQRDWRNVLMDAGFGESLTAHERWKAS